MRAFWTIGFMLFVAAAQAESPVKRMINLDEPGTLDAIGQRNPGHYRKIVEILRVAEAEPCETLPEVLKAQFGADETLCVPYQVLTSLPPKRHLTFTLGDTGYVTNAVQKKFDHTPVGPLIPAK